MVLVRTYDAASNRRSALSFLPSLLQFPRLVWTNRYMVQNFLRRDLLSRVNGSLLGVGWLLLQPMFLFLLYFLVFGVFLNNRATGAGPDIGFALYLFSGIVVFHAIMEATTVSSTIIVDNGNLVKKVAFPSEVLLVHPSAVSLVIYLVGAAVAFVFALAVGIGQPDALIAALPLVLIVQFLLTLGLGMLLANLYVFVRDISQLWRLISMAWMFVSPVFLRPSDMERTLGPSAFWFEVLNPAWALIQAHRRCLFGPIDPSFGEFWSQLGIASLWAIGFLLVGFTLFVSRKHKYSDVI
jgi:lipopolysaccharide transport system permease protein